MATGGRAGGGNFRRQQPRQQNRERYREREPDRREVDQDNDLQGTAININSGPTTTPGLEPVGNTGLYQSPPEPVDPYDCDRWPNSPFCGGTGASLDRLGLDPEFTVSECEVCVTITPSLAYISLPPYTVCYRKPECRPRSEKLSGGLLPPPPKKYNFSGPFDLSGQTRNCYLYDLWLVIKGYTVNPNTGQYTKVEPVEVVIPNIVAPIGKVIVRYDSQGYGQVWVECHQIYRFVIYPEDGHFLLCRTYVDPPIDFKESNVGGLIALEIGFVELREKCYETFAYSWWGYVQGNHDDNGPGNNPWWQGPPELFPFRYPLFAEIYCVPWKKEIGPLPPPQPCEPCMSCCCNTPTEQEEIQRKIMNDLAALKKVIAPDQFPVSMPKNLLAYEDGQQTNLPNYPRWFAWFIQQFDQLAGQFPIEVEITDIDPTKEGNQTRKIELPNIAEALAEIYGLSVTTNVNTDLNINFLLRMVSEIIAIKNASLITQDYARANAQFLGYKGNPAKREIPYSFDPTKLDTLEGLLSNSKGYISGWKNDDKETVVAFLQRLMFAAGIIKAAFFRNSDRIFDLKDELTQMGSTEDDEKFWERFIQMINDPESAFNKRSGSDSTPRVRDIPTL